MKYLILILGLILISCNKEANPIIGYEPPQATMEMWIGEPTEPYQAIHGFPELYNKMFDAQVDTLNHFHFKFISNLVPCTEKLRILRFELTEDKAEFELVKDYYLDCAQ
jgi:hypothetical protein